MGIALSRSIQAGAPITAEVFWTPNLDPRVVLVAPAPRTFRDARDLGGLTLSQGRIASEGCYVVVEGATGRLPVVLANGATAATALAAVIPLDDAFLARAASAARLWRRLSNASSARQPAPLTRQRRQRLSLALRALDARQARATYRELAEALFGADRIPATSAWKTHELRDRTIRIVRVGLQLMRGGYLDLLRLPRRQRR